MPSDFRYPQELLDAICAQVYNSSLPPHQPSLDPLITTQSGIPTGLPSSIPPANWPEPMTRQSLANLCLTSRAWYAAAKPWLWMKLEVRLPRNWLGLVEQVAWNYEEETIETILGRAIRAAAEVVASTLTIHHPDQATAQQLKESLCGELDGPDTSIPLELLSPVASREPSPRRIRPKSKSPARWKIVRSINDAIQNVLKERNAELYIPIPDDPRPGRYVRHLDFNHFRTIGMRRSIEEGVNSRFVTGERLEAILKEMPNLTTFGATEYMDGALTLPVLNELFLRGAPSRGRWRPSRGRGAIMENHEIEEEIRERRRECKELEAVDLTGCVSVVFVNALTEFVNNHLIHPDHSENDAVRPYHDETLIFPGLQRLCLGGAKSIAPRILGPFVLAFPSLTHLDLSCTRVMPDVIAALGQSSTMRLKSLALSRCTRLTGESIRDFLIYSPVTSQLEELNLYGDVTYASPLSEDDLRHILDSAPCFLSGNLVYLDLSSAPLTRTLLMDVCRPQQKLRSLGLSHIPNLDLKAIADFLLSKAPNVEVLALVGSTPELEMRPRAGAEPRSLKSSIALHTQLIRPLCTSPFSCNLSTSTPSIPPPTRLRVIEMSTMILNVLGAGADAWRIVKSKGGRGWYVDTASGWVANGKGSEMRRDLEPDHPFRKEMQRLADANGNVNSGIGWHARKMEVLHGLGMLGREDGLYGAVSFAYQS
ncbi:hypothetical protein M378DRAFT_106133 [Amanita muscaria Koide BX008]|uniref:Uncharacterized protein n=1 Tax=Amanita muscaria (strain Koide BX008) TaxID=946122 RepID=A0A0C2TCC8_AMAMK|nr:hypothetical protein M378DRAFT_106133 [Amanita muscaria Koide BX008]